MTKPEPGQTSPPSRSTDELFEWEWGTDSERLLRSAESAVEDFEHQRIFAKVRGQLFGKAASVRVGRYAVLERIGTGGMGEVYLGEDSELGRKVALKRVRGLGGPREELRLRREAQLLAQLSHPNVVQIYEVGEHDGQTFLAMEYVEGQTLSAWLQTERSQKEILARFVAAGRGLAAAHGVGIVHRDFKPENVLISDAGTVRVVDFGLAQTVEEGASIEEGGGDLRATGSVGGTVSYMPLEQLRGGEIDARSDQFAFCIALYEALWGGAPFARDTTDARLDALERDAPRIPRGAPKGLWRVVRCGLRRDPAMRWPDMAALLDALERAPRRRRVVRTASFAAGVLCLGLGAGLTSEEPCADLQPGWDVVAEVRLEGSLGTLTLTETRELEILTERLERNTRRWRAERNGLCRDARPWSSLDSDFMRKHQKLARSAQQVRDFLSHLEREPGRLPWALGALDGLGGRPALEPPTQLRGEVARLELELDRARLSRLFGDPEQALVESEHISRDAVYLGYEPLRAHALVEIAKAQDVLGHADARLSYDMALELARKHGLDTVVVELLLARVLLRGSEQLSLARGELEQAKARLERMGIDPEDHPRYVYGRGHLGELGQEFEEARSDYERALELEGDGSKETDYLRTLARLDQKQGYSDETIIERFESSVEAAEEFYGVRHRRTAMAHYALAKTLLGGDDPEGAKRSFARAARIWSEVEVPARALKAHLEIVGIELREGQLAKGEEAREAALVRAEKALEPALALELASPSLLGIQAQIAAGRDRHEEAIRLGTETLESYTIKDRGAEDRLYWSMRKLVATERIAAGGEERLLGCLELGGMLAREGRARPLVNLGEECFESLSEELKDEE